MFQMLQINIKVSWFCFFSLIKIKDIYTGDTLNMCRSAMRMTVWMCGIFLICRLGDDVNGRFNDISKILYQNACPMSPLQSDKRLSKMIMAAKKPVYLYGCFNVRCIRETFREVSHVPFCWFTIEKYIQTNWNCHFFRCHMQLLLVSCSWENLLIDFDGFFLQNDDFFFILDIFSSHYA